MKRYQLPGNAIAAVILLIALFPVPAEPVTSEHTAAFLRYGSGARALALGKSVVAVADDADAVYWNPAGLAQLEKRQFSYLFARPLGNFSGLTYHTFAFAVPPSEVGAFGIDFVYFDAGNFEGYDDQGNRIGDFGASSYAIHTAYAHQFSSNASWGITTKYVRESIAGSSGNGFGADLGFFYTPQKADWSLGLMAQDIIGAQIKLSQESYRMPVRFWFGAAWHPYPEFTLSIAADKSSRSDMYGHYGLEYAPAPPLVLRIGYTDDSDEFSAGVGFISGPYNLDYSYSTNADLGDSHRIGFRMYY